MSGKNSRLVSCKKESDIPMSNISLEVVDNKITAVIITASDGGFVKITKSSSYSEELRVCKEEPLIEAYEWCLSGKLLGVADFSETFTSDIDASTRLCDIQRETGVYDDDRLGLSIEKRTVLTNNNKII